MHTPEDLIQKTRDKVESVLKTQYPAFSLMFDDTICFAHSIAGINADENEIITSIQSVALIADHYVDEIMTMAGGERCSEVSGI